MSEIGTNDEAVKNTEENTENFNNTEVECDAGEDSCENIDVEFVALTEAETKKLQQELDDAKLKIEENWNSFLAAKAETDNIRKRASTDVEKAHKLALKKFIPELLGIKDSLEMGVKAANEEGADLSKIIEGSDMTIEMFNKTFDKFGVSEISPVGELFNPEFHQAVTMIPSPEHEPNVVIDVIQKGYALNDLLLRPAMVIVSQKTS